MSQLENGSRNSSVVRQQGQTLGNQPGRYRVGFDVTPSAPGVVPLPPVESSGGRMAAQLGQALGVLGQLGQQIGNAFDRETNRIERKNAKLDRLDEATAAVESRARMVQLQQDIADGKVFVPTEFLPDDPNRTAKFAMELINADVNHPDISEAYKREYTSIAPSIVSSLVKQQVTVRDQARDEAVQKYADAAMVKRDPKETEQYVKAAMQQGLTEMQARQRVQLPIGMAIATDPALSPSERITQFQAWQKSMGGNFAMEQQKAGIRASDENKQAAHEIEQTKNAYEAALERDVRNKRQSEEDRVYTAMEQRNYGAALQAIDKSVYLTAEKRTSLRESATKKAQGEGSDQIRMHINDGTLKQNQVREIVNGRAKLDRTDLNYIDPNEGTALINAAAERTKTIKDEEDVAAFLKGDPNITLWSAQHDSAMTKAIGPSPNGMGLIDASNNIAKPVELAATVAKAGFVPKDTQAIIFANLRSNDPAKVQAAVQTIGIISSGAPRVAVDMSNAAKAASPATAMMYDTAIAQFKAGNTNDPQALAVAAQNVIAAEQAAPDLRKPDPGIIARLEHLSRDKVFIDNKVREMIVNLRDLQNPDGSYQYRAAKNFGLFGFDFLSADPSILDTGQGAGEPLHDFVARIYSQEYQRLSAHQDFDTATAIAEKNTMSQLRNSVDFVPWNGNVTPVLIDQPGKIRMPEALRWGPGFEEEAKAAYAEKGVKTQVFGMAPYLDDPANIGWVYLDENAQPIRGESKNVLVFTPAPETQKQNAILHKRLDEQFDKYGSTPKKSLSDTVNDSTVGRYR